MAIVSYAPNGLSNYYYYGPIVPIYLIPPIASIRNYSGHCISFGIGDLQLSMQSFVGLSLMAACHSAHDENQSRAVAVLIRARPRSCTLWSEQGSRV